MDAGGEGAEAVGGVAQGKAIPAARDRMQSRLLVSGVAPLLTAAAVWAAAEGFGWNSRRMLMTLAVSAAFALVAWLSSAATAGGAGCGAAICLLLTSCALRRADSLLHSGLAPLALLFAMTFAATRLGRRRKEARGLAEPRSGRRASQVIANLGVAGLCAAWMAVHPGVQGGWMYVAAVAALAEATADTVSSEIGQAFGGRPILLTTLRRVAVGTDGAVSVVGTAAGVAGAAAIAAVAIPAGSMRWVLFAVIVASAIAGLFFDTLLGATVERRGWLGNDLVNCASTAFAAGVSCALAHCAAGLL